MVYLRGSCRTRLDRIRNENTGEMIEVKKDITDEVQKRQLVLSGHTNKMTEMPQESTRIGTASEA
jgi:hypothetical protein